MDYRIDANSAQKKTSHGNERRSKPRRKLTIKRIDGSILTLTGKIVQVLEVLLANFKSGCIGLDFSRATTAFRYANHICDLRKMGLHIETQFEKAGDCTIGRYFLRESLTIIEGTAQ